jgi:hypothetical protein
MKAKQGIVGGMGLPPNSITLTPAQVEELNQKLGDARHNINNYLALIVAAVELIRRKPDLSPKFIESIGLQPDKVIQELKLFTDQFESHLGITRDNPEQSTTHSGESV